MKKPILKIITLLLFTAVAISSCSVEYRQRRNERRAHPDEHRVEVVHRY